MKRGFFWVTGDPVESPLGAVQAGSMFVEWLSPDHDEAELPAVVLVHGGGGQGTDYLGTPDGRPGWAQLLADVGHQVYVVDRPGHGRSPYDATVLEPMAPTWGAELIRNIFVGTGPSGAHTQWPGDLTVCDPLFDQFAASQGPMPADSGAMHARERDRLVQLLEQVGPAVVMAHSAGGPGAFLAADARPDLVQALVAVETLGPPFVSQPESGVTLSWGLANAPFNYEPRAGTPAELSLTVVEVGPPPMVLQKEPARRLPNLAQVPIAVVTGEASPFLAFDRHLVAYLKQAGCAVDLLRLHEHGVRGNGHGMMLESNNAEVLDAILPWVRSQVRQLRASGQ